VLALTFADRGVHTLSLKRTTPHTNEKEEKKDTSTIQE
jgi:hypothetical protein